MFSQRSTDKEIQGGRGRGKEGESEATRHYRRRIQLIIHRSTSPTTTLPLAPRTPLTPPRPSPVLPLPHAFPYPTFPSPISPLRPSSSSLPLLISPHNTFPYALPHPFPFLPLSVFHGSPILFLGLTSLWEQEPFTWLIVM